MDYDGLYNDLRNMAQEAAVRAAMWYEFDKREAMIKLEFAAECERFASDLFLRGFGK